jgi:hypothetical protein
LEEEGMKIFLNKIFQQMPAFQCLSLYPGLFKIIANVIIYTCFFYYNISVTIFAQNLEDIKDLEKSLEENEIKISLKNNKMISGGLLFVRDSGLIVYSRSFQNKSTISTLYKGIRMISNTEIYNIIISGRSKVATCMAFGTAGGFALGFVIGLASGDDPPGFMAWKASQKAMAAGAMLGAIGLAGGLLVGLATSTGDKEFEPLQSQKMVFLETFARYRNEPEFLNQIK